MAVDDTWTVLKVLRWTQTRFTERGLASPRLDAELLLAKVLGGDRVSLYTHFDQPLGRDELAAYRELIRRRLGGEPVAYLVGRREFWSMSFAVDERVLIPRPETEHLVEAVLASIKGRAAPRVADIGTGSGAVAVAVAHERPDAQVIAVDLSPAALAVARANAAAHAVDVEFIEGDLLAALAGRGPFNAIASNPPYIREDEMATLPVEVRREPPSALCAGPDGLSILLRLVTGALSLLAPEGALVLEVGRGQAEAVAEAMRAAGLGRIERHRDLGGIERVVVGRRPAAV
jgi:release factor glutamine methyltransferase